MKLAIKRSLTLPRIVDADGEDYVIEDAVAIVNRPRWTPFRQSINGEITEGELFADMITDEQGRPFHSEGEWEVWIPMFQSAYAQVLDVLKEFHAGVEEAKKD